MTAKTKPFGFAVEIAIFLSAKIPNPKLQIAGKKRNAIAIAVEFEEMSANIPHIGAAMIRPNDQIAASDQWRAGGAA